MRTVLSHRSVQGETLNNTNRRSGRYKPRQCCEIQQICNCESYRELVCASDAVQLPGGHNVFRGAPMASGITWPQDCFQCGVVSSDCVGCKAREGNCSNGFYRDRIQNLQVSWIKSHLQETQPRQKSNWQSSYMIPRPACAPATSYRVIPARCKRELYTVEIWPKSFQPAQSPHSRRYKRKPSGAPSRSRSLGKEWDSTNANPRAFPLSSKNH